MPYITELDENPNIPEAVDQEHLTAAFELDPSLFELSGPTPGISDTDEYELPVGYVDDEGNLHSKVVQRLTKGKAEDRLFSRSLGKKGRNNTEFLARIIVSLGDLKFPSPSHAAKVIHDMWSTDRTYMLFKARVFNLGPMWHNAPFICENCGGKTRATFDLNEHIYGNLINPKTNEVPRSEEEVIALWKFIRAGAKEAGVSVYEFANDLPKPPHVDHVTLPHYVPCINEEVRKKRSWTIKVPSGSVIEFKLIQGHQEHGLAKVLERDNADELTALLTRAIVAIDGNHRLSHREVASLSWKDRVFLREVMQKYLPGGRFDLTTTLDKCTNCGASEVETTVNLMDKDFFSLSSGR